MMVTSREAHASSTIVTNNPPKQRLAFAFGEKAPSVPYVVDSKEIFLGRSCGTQGQGLGMVVYVEIEFVHCINGRDPASGFVTFHGFDLRSPERIYGHAVLEESTDPWEVVLFTLFDTGVHGIMHKDDTDLIFSNQLVHFVPTMTNHLRSVRIDYDGLGVVQDRLLFGPTGMDDGIDFDFGLSVEMFCKQMGTGLKLMVSGGMAFGSVKKNDLCIFAIGGKARK